MVFQQPCDLVQVHERFLVNRHLRSPPVSRRPGGSEALPAERGREQLPGVVQVGLDRAERAPSTSAVSVSVEPDVEPEHGGGAQLRREPVERVLERRRAAVRGLDCKFRSGRGSTAQRQEPLSPRDLDRSRRRDAKCPRLDGFRRTQHPDSTRDVEQRLLCGVLGRPRSRADDQPGGPDDERLELAQELVERVAVARNGSPGKPDEDVVAFHGRSGERPGGEKVGCGDAGSSATITLAAPCSCSRRSSGLACAAGSERSEQRSFRHRQPEARFRRADDAGAGSTR